MNQPNNQQNNPLHSLAVTTGFLVAVLSVMRVKILLTPYFDEWVLRYSAYGYEDLLTGVWVIALFFFIMFLTLNTFNAVVKLVNIIFTFIMIKLTLRKFK